MDIRFNIKTILPRCRSFITAVGPLAKMVAPHPVVGQYVHIGPYTLEVTSVSRIKAADLVSISTISHDAERSGSVEDAWNFYADFQHANPDWKVQNALNFLTQNGLKNRIAGQRSIAHVHRLLTLDSGKSVVENF